MCIRDRREGLQLLKSLQPDIVFSLNAHNGDSIPPAYFIEELSAFTRVVYTDYSLGILDDSGVVKKPTGDETKPGAIWMDYDQGFHRKAWMLCCVNGAAKRIYETASHQGRNAVVTGYPKLDRICQRRNESFWPIESAGRPFRLIWHVHHSLKGGWLGFGMFPFVCMEMLKWASDNPDIEIVLQPHPLIFREGIPRPELDYFMKPWAALPNTAVYHGDFVPLMAASDAMLADGVSFLYEYQLFGKPLIWLDSGEHLPFNAVGQQIIKGAYPVRTIAEAQYLVEQLRRGTDELGWQRQETVRYLMPYPGRSAENILASIRAKLWAES